MPAVRGQGLSRDQPLLVEALDDAAEIAGIETELVSDLFCGKVVAMGELVADFTDREHRFRAIVSTEFRRS
ncbi:hypothetical protein ACVIM7_006920 [Bradyrhizobium liaoningense]